MCCLIVRQRRGAEDTDSAVTPPLDVTHADKDLERLCNSLISVLSPKLLPAIMVMSSFDYGYPLTVTHPTRARDFYCFNGSVCVPLAPFSPQIFTTNYFCQSLQMFLAL